MTALVLAVFVASLLGSTHCAGMCGAFVVFAVAGQERRAQPPAAVLHAAYNGGRLLVYIAFGMAAGAAGHALELGASLAGIQHAAAVGAGGMMALVGIVSLLRLRGVRVPKLGVPKPMQRAAMRGHRAASNQPPLFRALLTGLLTTLLPCGWLYMFVITAAGTGHPLHGAVVMAFFWLGTLPILVAIGVAARRITGPLAQRIPVVMALLLVAVGSWMVIDRTRLIPETRSTFLTLQNQADSTTTGDLVDVSPSALPCHGEGGSDANDGQRQAHADPL